MPSFPRNMAWGCCLWLSVMSIEGAMGFTTIGRSHHRSSSCTSGLKLSTHGEQQETTATATYSLEVSYEGRSYETSIRQGESILAALERTGVADQLAMPSMPSDCRRGNCLTCVGRHDPESNTSNAVRGEDGLSPYMSAQAKQRGYILTCSSRVVGDGVKLRLGANNEAWDELYRSRLEEEETERTGRAAMAKVIRLNAERNVEEWTKETEETLRKTE